MSISIKIVMHSKKYPDGTQALMIQCIASAPGGSVVKRRTLLRVRPDQFDKESGRVKNHPNQTLMNTKISNEHHEAEARLLTWQLQSKPIDPAAVIAANGLPISLQPTFLNYGWQYVKRCELNNKEHTAKKYGSHLSKLAEYLGKDADGKQKDILMDDVTEDWLLHWSVWLKNNGTKSSNTLHRRMAFVNTVFNDARKRGVTKADPLAFITFKEGRVKKPKLNQDQIRQLEEVELSGFENDARNTFLLQYYVYGARISDALSWKKADIRRDGSRVYLEYTSVKSGRLLSVRLNPKALEIIEYYLKTVSSPFLLPWLSRSKKLTLLTGRPNKEYMISQISSKTSSINSYLKAINDKVLFPLNLTTHIARHTFATLADSQIADKRKISAALGHSKFATTELYLSELGQDQVNDAMEGIWG